MGSVKNQTIAMEPTSLMQVSGHLKSRIATAMKEKNRNESQ